MTSMPIKKLIWVFVFGLIIALIGTLSTALNVFHQRVVWVSLIFLGVTLILCSAYYLIETLPAIEKTPQSVDEFLLEKDDKDDSVFRMKNGILFFGDEPNVAFRVDTIQKILKSIQNLLNDPTKFRYFSRQIGYEVGYDFYQDLLAANKKNLFKSGRRINEKLDIWNKYDSATGLGIFKNKVIYQPIKNNGAKIEGSIVVTNSFLTQGRYSEVPCCSFMEGYINGVIEKILDSEQLSPEHKTSYVKESECACVTSKDECYFKVDILAHIKSGKGY